MNENNVASLKPWEVFVAKILNLLLPLSSITIIIFSILKFGKLSLTQFGVLFLIAIALNICQNKVSTILKWVKEHEKSNDNSGE